MKNLNKPHDSLFKNIFNFKNNTIQLIKTILPEYIINYIDLDNIMVFFYQYIGKNLKSKYADIVIKIKLKYNYKHFDTDIYNLIEYKSYKDKYIHLQILDYILKIKYALRFCLKRRDIEKDKDLLLYYLNYTIQGLNLKDEEVELLIDESIEKGGDIMGTI